MKLICCAVLALLLALRGHAQEVTVTGPWENAPATAVAAAQAEAMRLLIVRFDVPPWTVRTMAWLRGRPAPDPAQVWAGLVDRQVAPVESTVYDGRTWHRATVTMTVDKAAYRVLYWERTLFVWAGAVWLLVLLSIPSLCINFYGRLDLITRGRCPLWCAVASFLGGLGLSGLLVLGLRCI